MNECCILATKLVFASIYVSWDNFLKKLKNIEQFSSIHINAMVNPQAPPETAATTNSWLDHPQWMPGDSAKERSGKQVFLQGSDEKTQLALYTKAT